MRIDFVSDLVCPWCAVGLNSLERALERIGGGIPVELHFQPFELNPQMPPEGEDAAAHLARKYALTPQQLERNRATLRERGAEVGFQFGHRDRIWNTFDAHRLLHWAGLQGRQRELKHALLQAYHGRGENPGAHDVLIRLAGEVGLDAEQARELLASGRYAAEVRAEERRWQELGINSVPSVIVDGQYLIQGGQPPAVFEQALREIAAAPPPEPAP
ncbi:DsbA family oxidoreductase [Ideonella sp.]|uniref:DsbA family oxidoreductase n=1 Tax=Ideonella sp. TaxID=1929293 RepID=UPI002B46F094|nr:DsbA family oxidoreductase [Ideonella sp.]HJV67522.1 DsbA family oxidoreductase [Ideonella sp.]